MPKPSVAVPYEHFRLQANRHASVVAGLPAIDVTLQKLLAELVMMRLFDDFQEALSGVALRLVCGAPYADGAMPALLTTPATSVVSARDLLINYGRPKARSLKWSKVQYINETIGLVMDSSDHFGAACSAQSLLISEMQAVRNRIAHNNSNSRGAYRVVLKRHYGSALNHITPGLFLLSPRSSPIQLSRYIQACRATLRAATRH